MFDAIENDSHLLVFEANSNLNCRCGIGFFSLSHSLWLNFQGDCAEKESERGIKRKMLVSAERVL